MSSGFVLFVVDAADPFLVPRTGKPPMTEQKFRDPSDLATLDEEGMREEVTLRAIKSFTGSSSAKR